VDVKVFEGIALGK